ncbi:MAG: PD-(D/E)XK nuclease family protein [Fimbriimonadaceae bacterium]|nr:PD-(D/E)XK nuclease family protein [Fimbriimonadaceae bacterium]QOJ11238.1 MAG: PD-(D/E)XK nuclease family protein [Chthonomonadaceae bacterium]
MQVTAWSFSRHKSLRGCPRAHWFAYYRQGEPDAGLMLAHSKLVTRYMFVGQIADSVAGSVLNHVRRAGKLPDVEKVEAYARELGERNIASSRINAEKVLAGKAPPFGAQVLDDHVWQSRPVLTDEQVVKRVAAAAIAFASSGIVLRLLKSPIETWPKPRVREDPRPEAWQIGDYWVSSAPDSWLDETERFTVMDWKASRQIGQDDGFQLAVYGLWAVYSRGISPDRVYSQVVLMPLRPDFEPAPIGAMQLEFAQETIETDCIRERSMVDVEMRRPGAEEFIADRDRFPAQPDSQKCPGCKFKAICPEGLSSLVKNGATG